MRRHWLVERVKGVRSISNAYSIGREADRVSADLDAQRFRTPDGAMMPAPDYAAVIADAQRDRSATDGRAASVRLRCSVGAKADDRCRHDGDAARSRVCRQTDPDWHPQHATTRTICMHAADGERGGQTVRSLISELRASDAVHWVTGRRRLAPRSSNPCWFGIPLPSHGPRPTDRFDPRTLWWLHERLHRAMLGDFASSRVHR